MSRIRSKNSKLDIAMAELLKTNNILYERYPKIYGNPDFLVGDKIALFCDSSFWHGRDWNSLRKQLSSGSNSKYWLSHILKNRRRDKEVTRVLSYEGFTVLRFWDKQIKSNPEKCILRIQQKLRHLQTPKAKFLVQKEPKR